MNADDLIALNDEIAGMARAGLPLDQGLAALARAMNRGKLRRVTAALAEDLRAGHTLPEALQRQGRSVPPFYAGLVTAGVRTGRIGEVLATLTTYARALTNLRAIVLDALFYPCVVLVFAFTLFALVCFFILPEFEKIYHDLHMRLPRLTEMVLALGRHPLLSVLPLLGLLLGIALLWLCLRFTARGRYLWAQLLYAIPVLGTLVRSARLAAFTDLLAILVDHSVPLPEAFRLAGEASSDPIMAVAARQVDAELSQGHPLGEVLRGRGLVPEWVSWLTGLGERRGTLAQSLHQVAEMYRRQVEMRAALLRNVLPPLLIIGTAGLFVGLFIFVLMLPLYHLLDGLSGVGLKK